MTDGLLTALDQKEGLSLVYVKALATRLGYLISRPEPDRDSVDLRIHAGSDNCPALDLQLKATAGFGAPRNGTLPFRLSIKNYDDLRVVMQTTRLLIVLDLPKGETCWLTVIEENFVLWHRAYWLSLQRSYDEMTGQKTIHISEEIYLVLRHCES